MAKQGEGDTPNVVAGVEVNAFVDAVGLEDARTDADDVDIGVDALEEACLEDEMHGDERGGEGEGVLEDGFCEVEKPGVCFIP